VDRLIIPSPTAHLRIVNIKVCVCVCVCVCKNRHQSSTAVHDTHPQYSHYDSRISVGTLSELLGCSSPF